MHRGSVSRRTLLVVLGACVICFYLGRVTVSSDLPRPPRTPEFDQVLKQHSHDSHNGEEERATRHPNPTNTDKDIFAGKDLEDLDEPLPRRDSLDAKKPKFIQEDDEKPEDASSSPSSSKSSWNPKPPTPGQCYKVAHVRDNERAGQRGFLAPEFYRDCKPEALGSARGEWQICTLGLGSDSLIWSFGISSSNEGTVFDASFERDALNTYDATVIILDPTPAARDVADRLIASAEGTFRQQVEEKKFVFYQLGLWEKDGSRDYRKDGTMVPDADPLHPPPSPPVSEDVQPAEFMRLPVIRFNTALCMFAPFWIDILKIDVPELPPQVIADLERVEELPVDQILVNFRPMVTLEDKRMRDILVRTLKRKGFLAWHGEALKDEKITFVRAMYLSEEQQQKLAPPPV